MNPKYEINYSYKNNEDGRLYYSESQETFPENRRDYYYGITIDWYFKIYLPKQPEPLFYFNLQSNPAIRFSANTKESTSVYSNMVYSAFKDLETEFSKQFFK